MSNIISSDEDPVFLMNDDETTMTEIDVKPEPTFILEGLRRNSNLIVFDGFAYHTNYTTDKMKYLQCAARVPLGCPARATMSLEGENKSVQLKKPHSHGPDPHLIQRTTFIQELKHRVVHQAGTIKQIYDQACRDFPNASSLVAFQTIEQTLRRVRASTQPKNPANLLEYGELISQPEWKRFSQTVNGRPFYSTTLEGNDGSVAVIFSNPDFIEKVSSSTQLHIDASFIMEPNIGDGRYFFSAHVIMHRHSNAIMYALMTHRSQAMYMAILSHLKQIAPNLVPTHVICDYERALFLAVRDTFPKCTIQGSYYHYLQHVYQRLLASGIVNVADNDVECATLIRHIMALPLLPVDKIAIGLNLIDDEAKLCCPGTMYKKIIDYLEKEWWRGVTAPLMSCYNLPETTNNNINMFHKTIRQRFRGVSNAWVFTEKLKEVECLTFRDFELLLGGHAIGRERKTKLLTSDDKLCRAWRMLESRRLPTAVFFERAAEVIRPIESQFRMMIDEYEEIELVRGVDILGEGYTVQDRKQYANYSEGLLANAIKKRKMDSTIVTVPSKVPNVVKRVEEEKQVDSKVCLACQDEDWEARCMLKPCGHKPFCSVCAARLVSEKTKCPKCKKIPNAFAEFESS